VLLAIPKAVAILLDQVHPFSAPPRIPFTCLLPRQAVFGNAGSLISFRVGERDAKALADEFGNGYDASQFSSLDNFEVLVKSLSGGRHGEPFFGRTLPSLNLPGGRREKVIRRSREKYAGLKRDVEGKIDRWMKRRPW
jgi:hypothetical protein